MAREFIDAEVSYQLKVHLNRDSENNNSKPTYYLTPCMDMAFIVHVVLKSSDEALKGSSESEIDIDIPQDVDDADDIMDVDGVMDTDEMIDDIMDVDEVEDASSKMDVDVDVGQPTPEDLAERFAAIMSPGSWMDLM
ncbi:hypothetical protein C8R41DRAFT_870819 [Lentinula lateritia]|uniref:Uncharacterized protein n=1 Tax=Lentinula lateritia TaxID=40482 RepID=A0ABQ8V3L3_9AGAR|nr:hypothetical protein C8R41DRAFT_870819 [Lentinula lateritia]